MNLASLVRSPTSFSSLFLSVLVRRGGLFIVGTFGVGAVDNMVVFDFDCILSHCLLLVEGLGVGFKFSKSLVEFLTILKNRQRCVTGFFFLLKFFTEYCMCDRFRRDRGSLLNIAKGTKKIWFICPYRTFQ